MRYLVESCFTFLLCATSVFSVSMWLSYAAFPSTTETQRAPRLHREIQSQRYSTRHLQRAGGERRGRLRRRVRSLSRDGGRPRACAYVSGLAPEQIPKLLVRAPHARTYAARTRGRRAFGRNA